MKKMAVFVLTLTIALGATNVWAERDKSGDCVAAVNKCLQMFREMGPEHALKIINDNRVVDEREPYVFASDMSNVILAHPSRPNWRGRNMNTTKDANDRERFKVFKTVAETRNSGWVEYSSMRLGEDKPGQTRTYISRVPGHNIYVGASYYPTADSKSPAPDPIVGFLGSGEELAYSVPRY